MMCDNKAARSAERAANHFTPLIAAAAEPGL